MKNRIVAIIGGAAVLVAIILVVIRTTSLRDVPAEEFRDAVYRSGTATLAYKTSASSDLPLMISFRFPGPDQNGGLGYPDRIDIYTLAFGQEHFDCNAHVRQNRICFVSFDGGNPSKEFKSFLAAEFPNLSIE